MPQPPSAPRPTEVHGCGRLVLRLLTPLLLACTWLAAPPAALADGCAGCPSPSLSDLQGAPGFGLASRKDFLGRSKQDYYILDKGECEAHIQGIPVITIEDTWLALRASGEVWNCPHSKSSDTITVEAASSDSTEWSFTVTLGSELGPVGATLKREIQMGRTTGSTVTEVTRVSKTITPTFCHRIQWDAYFVVAKVKAVGHYAFKQRWAWWTKNTVTGSTQVHASGDVYMDCGSGSLVLTRKAPLAGHFELTRRGCDGPECVHITPKRLGMFPPWVPPGGALPDAEPADDAPLDETPGDTPEEVPEEEAGTAPEPATSSGDSTEPESPREPEASAPTATAPPSSADLGEAPTGSAADPLTDPLADPLADPLKRAP